MGDTNVGCNHARGGDGDDAMMMIVVVVSPLYYVLFLQQNKGQKLLDYIGNLWELQNVIGISC